jgi:putative heme-binding domain-containing protein
MLNLHGRRINCDLPERSGSGYLAKHGTDMALMADPFFRGIDLSSGPDGAVYVLDWSDTGECHEATGVHRSSGRVYRISHRDAKPPRRESWRGAPGLFASVSESDEWHVRAARQEMIKRFLEGEPLDHDRAVLEGNLNGDSTAAVRLKSLWALHATGGISEEKLLRLLIDPVESIRAWAVRLLVDAQPLDTPLSRIRATALAENRFAAMTKCAAEDNSGLVRLALASALQRLPAGQRLELAKVLAVRAKDANDHNFPAMLWYALMPLAQSHPEALASLAAIARQPLTRQCIARSLTAQIDTQAAAVDAMLKGATSDPAALNDITEGMALALKGRRKAPAPASWSAVAAGAAASPQLTARVRDLSVVFGDGRALEEIRALVQDKSADIQIRKNALTSFIEAKPDDLRAVCEVALKERFLNAVAVTGLTGFDDPALGKKIAGSYGSFHPVDRPALISALASRPVFATALLDAIAGGTISRTELSAFQARRIAAFNDAALTEKLKSVWGAIRESTTERRALIAKLKTSLTKESLASADLKSGRVLFTSLCATCHTLYGEGGKIGPDLTGSQRHDLDYLLENIIDPSAVVTADFKMSLVHLKDGSTASGIITAKSDKSVSINEPTGPRTFDAANIASIEASADSLMPAGVLEVLPADQVKSLLAWLMHPSQVTP